MVPIPIIFTASLPNGQRTEIDFIDMEPENWISPTIVESLLKTGEIIREGDQVFVEFHKKFKTGTYFDGAWCNIGSMAAPCIMLGGQWLEERGAIITSDRTTCILKPNHLEDQFTFVNMLLSPPKRMPQKLIMPPATVDSDVLVSPTSPITPATPDDTPVTAEEHLSNTSFTDQPKVMDTSEVNVQPDAVIPEQQEDPCPSIDVQLDSIVKESEVEVQLMSKTVIDDVSSVMTFEAGFIVTWQQVDFIGSDLYKSANLKIDILFQTVPINLCAPITFAIILQFFKTRGRVFSNKRRMMGKDFRQTEEAAAEPRPRQHRRSFPIRRLSILLKSNQSPVRIYFSN